MVILNICIQFFHNKKYGTDNRVCVLRTFKILRVCYTCREVYAYNTFAEEGGPSIFKFIASIRASGLWKSFTRFYELVSMQYSWKCSYSWTSIYDVTIFSSSNWLKYKMRNHKNPRIAFNLERKLIIENIDYMQYPFIRVCTIILYTVMLGTRNRPP
jgi:hypothetical protein